MKPNKTEKGALKIFWTKGTMKAGTSAHGVVGVNFMDTFISMSTKFFLNKFLLSEEKFAQ